MSLDMCARIMKARNQSELEMAHFGEAYNNRERLELKAAANRQINGSSWDEVGYKAFGYIQLGVLQMGLGESMEDAAYNIIKGWNAGLSGTDVDVANITVIAWCTLAYWTDRTTQENKFRLNLIGSKFGEEIRKLTENTPRGELQDELIIANQFEFVMTMVWNRQGGDRPFGPQTLPRLREICQRLDKRTRNQLSIERWVISRVS